MVSIIVVENRDPTTNHIVGPSLTHQDNIDNAMLWLLDYCRTVKTYNDAHFTVSEARIESGPWKFTPERSRELSDFQKTRIFKRFNWFCMTKELLEVR